MRHPLTWSDLADKHVGVWGLGVEGHASVARLAQMNIEPVLVDDKLEALDGTPVLLTANGGIDVLSKCDVVIKSPGISRYKPEAIALEDAGVALVGGLGLWMESIDRTRVMCVTGTKGKSTTAAVARHLLERLGHRSFIGGNFGNVPFDPAIDSSYDYWIIEVSSHQATDLTNAPAVIGLTSLHSDHLDWHGTRERYVADKLSICTLEPEHATIANGLDESLREHHSLLGKNVTWIEGHDVDAQHWVDVLGLTGEHNRMNAVIAQRCIQALGVDAPSDELEVAAQGFGGLEHRLQFVASLDGVDFVDDGLATNVLPTLAALESFPNRRIALLAGGFDRGIDYLPLATALIERDTPTALIAMPDSGVRIVEELAARQHDVDVFMVETIEDAVVVAYEWAKPTGTVLLSPASASFNKYGSYAQRSAAFVAAIDGLATG